MGGTLGVLPTARRRFLLPFLDQRIETPTTATFRFDRTSSGYEFRSNQAIRLGLRVDDPWGPYRLFSLSSSPTETDWISVTCKLTGTPFKQALRGLRRGDTAEVIGPLGDLVYDPSRPTIMIAGGIGVTPFRGMIRFAVDSGFDQPIRLLYSARVPEEFAFREELDAMSGAHPDLGIVYSVTRPGTSRTPWTGRTGRIGEAAIREAAEPLDEPNFLVVGLPEMVSETVTLLGSRMAVPEERINWEPFRGF
ncbi:MAG TPA: FAD-dependent oxidoreductase [Thermoplasmata archaeon]|nr:FAD-dependent oxidoreductase [Thermoplasmata archaeon]